jgi:PAS domain S-box-containing protein
MRRLRPPAAEPPAKREGLRARLIAAEETLRAIGEGEVDAVVVTGGRGEQVYTLGGADRIYRKLVETMREGAVTLSPDGIILYCNSFMAGMLARPLDQILGSMLSDHMPPSDRPALGAVLERVRTEPNRREFDLITSAGQLLPVSISATTLQEDGAAPISCIVLTDLTEVRAQTAQLRAVNKDLEEFTAAVSHDLRAPLLTIDGYSRILLNKLVLKREPECRRYLELVCARIQTMGRLIDDLLAFSKLGRQPMAKSAVSMNAIVRSGVEMVRNQSQGRRPRFKIGNLAPCEGDFVLLRQVWVNLLANALKFTRSNPDALIQIDSYDAAGEAVYRIKDNGVGFDMLYVGNLFKPFQRLHSTEDFEGTGVGLAVVSRIVERHGGRIWARGEVGRGAVFQFTLGSAPNPARAE